MSSTAKKSKIIDEFFGKKRYGGILLHPTSLPSKYGIGDIGPELFRFIDFLYRFNQNIWQILPLGPTGYGDSPYQCLSSFAGNPMLISPDELRKDGLLKAEDLNDVPHFPTKIIDFSRVIPYKWSLLKRAFDNYNDLNSNFLLQKFKGFKIEHKQWIEEFALYMAIKQDNKLIAWNRWSEFLQDHHSDTLENWKTDHHREVEFQKFVQFLFFHQWEKIRYYAQQKNIIIIGDIPFFVSLDSADVWSHPELFYLKDGEPTHVSGVPPDYFSATGQRWGNPIYRWKQMKVKEYKWWIERVRHSYKMVDVLRIDHFRGFESYWQISVKEKTAERGEWIDGPGLDFFNVLRKTLGDLPIIAEDLGNITTSVKCLLQRTGYPGMRILQFAFGSKDCFENRFIPYNYDSNSIVYTGTHDNNTTEGWYENLSRATKKSVLNYLNSDGKNIVSDLIRLAWSSVAKIAVIPLQDLLQLGTEARMNTPGTESGNWRWRFTWSQLTEKRGKKLAELSKIYDRGGILKEPNC